jgi:hypothetical protein
MRVRRGSGQPLLRSRFVVTFAVLVVLGLLGELFMQPFGPVGYLQFIWRNL